MTFFDAKIDSDAFRIDDADLDSEEDEQKNYNPKPNRNLNLLPIKQEKLKPVGKQEKLLIPIREEVF